MALRIFVNNSIGDGIRADLGTTDDATIVQGAIVGSTDDFAIVGLGSQHTVKVDGSVFGDNRAVDLGRGSGTTFSNKVLIGTAGNIQSFADSAIVVHSRESVVDNRGSIWSDVSAIDLRGSDLGFGSKVFNSGTIEATRTAILAASATEKLSIFNSGWIKGSTAFQTNAAPTTFTNTGQVTGTIDFGTGSDVYDGRSGRLFEGQLGGEVRGRGGADTLLGGIDDDHFDGGEGNDTLEGGAGNDLLIGGTGADTIHGGVGDDRISGLEGTDQLFGDAGDDVFSVSDFEAPVGDMFNGGAGIDRIRFVANDHSDTLLLGNAGQVEMVEVVQFGRLNVSSVQSAMTLLGSNNANVLIGTLAFNDTILGNAGADQLVGRGGIDRLTGGLDADRFTYNTVADSSFAAGRDIITDFNRGQGDKIDLAPIDANSVAAGNQAFVFIGAAAFSGKAGQLRFQQSGSDSVIYADVNGDKVADLALISDAQTAFVAGDFIL